MSTTCLRPSESYLWLMQWSQCPTSKLHQMLAECDAYAHTGPTWERFGQEIRAELDGRTHRPMP